MEEKGENFFEKFGLEVCSGDVEVGKTYPIYGMITDFFSAEPGNVVVELNHSIKAVMTISDVEKIEVLKQRAFDPGIFVSTVTSKEQVITVSCSTVVFGRRPDYSA